jgi:type IV secretory pathway VirD2 relaxase
VCTELLLTPCAQVGAMLVQRKVIQAGLCCHSKGEVSVGNTGYLVLRGKDNTGRDLIISQAYLTRGMRERAAELATEWLGPRTEQEIRQSLEREVEQERWTSLDRTLQREAVDGLVRAVTLAEPRLQRQRPLLIGRLQHLQRLGLTSEPQPGVWAIHADAEQTLRAMGERGDILRTMQRALRGEPCELVVSEPGENGRTVVGRVAAKGLADELYEKGYLIIEGTDGKAHYVALPPKTELEQYPRGRWSKSVPRPEREHPTGPSPR